jgi:phospholipid/cholesterol/gamma-HCH transport system substrate-binding protein
MTRAPVRDFLVGCFLLLGIGAMAYLSMRVGGLGSGPPGGFKLFATFDETGGLKARAPVEISGVKVGQVKDIKLDKAYRARVELDLMPSLVLPSDTSASIVTSGVLGDRYVQLQLGGDPENLKDGDDLTFTESAVILERLIGKFIHNVGVDKGAKADDGAKPEDAKPEQTQ